MNTAENRYKIRIFKTVVFEENRHAFAHLHAKHVNRAKKDCQKAVF